MQSTPIQLSVALSVEHMQGAAAVVSLDANEAVYVCANDLHIRTWRMTGSPLGKRIADVLPEVAATQFLQQANKCLGLKSPIAFDTWFRQDSELVWVRNTLIPLTPGPDNEARILVTSLETTDRKHLESAFRAHRERLRRIVDSAYDAILTVDVRHRITFLNAAAERLFGYESHDLLGEDLAILLPQTKREHHAKLVSGFAHQMSDARRMEDRKEVYGRRKDGTEFRAQVSLSKLHLDTGMEMTAIIRDVSDTAHLIADLRKRATTDALTNIANRATG